MGFWDQLSPSAHPNLQLFDRFMLVNIASSYPCLAEVCNIVSCPTWASLGHPCSGWPRSGLASSPSLATSRLLASRVARLASLRGRRRGPRVAAVSHHHQGTEVVALQGSRPTSSLTSFSTSSDAPFSLSSSTPLSISSFLFVPHTYPLCLVVSLSYFNT